MGWGYWKPYVPVAKRRADAEKTIAKAQKAGKALQPVVVAGRTIARTFWGKAWCNNLEAYSDYANRLPRGRTYVRNGSVIDLKIEPGKVTAQVIGSSLYQIEIGIAAVSDAHWKSLAKQCTGSIASLVDLLQGKLSPAVMEQLCAPKTGLFPAPKDIAFDCSCPDWASMCKHVAAVLYGVGARLDAQPELLFTLRRVDANALVAQAAQGPTQKKKAASKTKVLDDALLSDVFGLEMAAPAAPAKKAAPRKARPAATPASAKKAPAKKKVASVPKPEPKPGSPAKPAAKRKTTPPPAPPAPPAAKVRKKSKAA